MSDSEDYGAAIAPTATNTTVPVDALQHSPLRRLPPELRLKIFTFALKQDGGLTFDRVSYRPLSDQTPVSQALNLRATCKQIRRETEGVFFAANEITLIYPPLTPVYLRKRTEKFLSSVDKIPPSLLPTVRRPRIIIRPTDYSPRLGPGPCLEWIVDELIHVAAISKSFAPVQVMVQVAMGNYHWCVNSVGEPVGNDGFLDGKICNREAPVSMTECVLLRVEFPVDDRATALSSVDQAFEKKLSLLEAHRGHRLCPVSIQLNKILDSLVPVRQRMHELIGRIPTSPNASKALN